jgi:hypothetical protein
MMSTVSHRIDLTDDEMRALLDVIEICHTDIDGHYEATFQRDAGAAAHQFQVLGTAWEKLLHVYRGTQTRPFVN